MRGNPRAPLTYFNDGGGGGGGIRQRIIFYTQKNHNFKICLPKKITTFFSIPKKIPWSFFRNPKKSLWFFFFATQKILAYFIDPKYYFGPKFQTQKNHSDPPVIKIWEWGPWGGNLSHRSPQITARGVATFQRSGQDGSGETDTSHVTYRFKHCEQD